MSRQIALDTILLRPTPRLAHTEYPFQHWSLVRTVTGLDPMDSEQGAEAWNRFFDAWEFDLVWNTDDGPVNWGAEGRVTDMGHGIFTEDASDLNHKQTCPFSTVEEVWAFDAVEEYGLPPMEDLVKYYAEGWGGRQAARPNQLVTGGYYRTIVSGAIQTFGWDMLLAAAADQDKFERVLDSFFRRTLYHVEAQAQTPIEVYISHDDMVWTEGAFMYPDFYRRAIFSRYKELWDVLHKAGKKVLFCSDGTYTEFIDDLAEAGADGFIFEPTNDLDLIVEKYGKTHAIVGSKVDCRTMSFGTQEQVRRQVDETLELAMGCPGFIFAVGNHIPPNVPIEIATDYMAYLRERWGRA